MTERLLTKRPLVTDESGDYACRLPQGWSGTLVPSITDFLFTPPSRSYSDLQSDLLDEDFLAIHPTHVLVPEDIPSIHGAMDYAWDGDTITVEPGEYVIERYPGLDFQGRNLYLRSEQGPEVTVLKYGTLCFRSGEGPDAIVEGFSITHSERGISCEAGSSPTLRDLIFEENEGYMGNGAGLYCIEDSSPMLLNSIFRDNDSDLGGALYCNSSAPILFNVRFESNSGAIGGAVFLEQSSAYFVSVRFVQNTASPYEDSQHGGIDVGQGGAVYCKGATPRFEWCAFIENEAKAYWYEGDTYGGACYVAGAATPVFLNCTFHENGVSSDEEALGGTIYCESSAAPSFSNSIIAYSSNGGGIYCESEDCGVALACCDAHGNTGGNYVGLPDQTGQNGNISAPPLFCDIEGGDFYLDIDSPCLPANNGCGVPMGAYGQGCAGTAAEPAVPEAFSLSQNHPNPFNPTTTIRFSLSRSAQVSLRIYDIQGRLIRRMLDGTTLPAGWHEVIWNGQNDSGQQLPSGVYFCRIEAGQYVETRKMTVLR